MKKIAFILLVVLTLVVLSISTCAENEVFTVRNGVHFGLSREAVKEIEIQNGFEDKLGKDVDLEKLYVSDISIAGFKGTGITYRFNTQDELYELDYVFYGISSDSKNDNIEAARALYSALKEKYGPSIKKEDGEDVYYMFTESLISDTKVYDLTAFEKFLIPSGDDYVIAELYIYNWGYSKRDQYTTVLAYRGASGEEVNAALEKNKQEQENAQQSIENDL